MPDQVIEDEFELTYLAASLPAELKTIQPKRLLDIYIPEDATDPHLRLRQKGEYYEITLKKPVDRADVSHHTEQTLPIEKSEFKALAVSSSNRVEKDRYELTINGYKAEIDVFRGTLQGLVVIDFEFASVSEKAAFTPPPICLADVTQEHFIAGGHIAGKTYADIQSDLGRFDYKKLFI